MELSTRADAAQAVASANFSAAVWIGTALFSCGVNLPVHGAEREPRHMEIWAGADVADDVWLIYSGATYAPFGDIHEDGWRLRVVGGYGQYSYKGMRCPIAIAKCKPQSVAFDAQTGFTDVLVGYQKGFGPLTAKAFVGAAGIGHFILPVNAQLSTDRNNLDPDNDAEGMEWGLKVGVELWLNITDDAYGSLNASWTSAHETFAASLRLGYRLTPSLSLGVEGGLNANANHDLPTLLEFDDFENATRYGVFARYEWDGGEISVGAGYTSAITESGSPYVTANWIMQF